MSLDTWKVEFYPTPACDCSAEDAIEHSLRKWRGLRGEALARHGLVRVDNGFAEPGGGCWFYVSASSCALCEHFYSEDEEGNEPRCAKCPLAIARGGFPCDDEQPGEADSPWVVWTADDDPEPMIAALEEAKKLGEGSGS
jgi:hypothetical protein